MTNTAHIEFEEGSGNVFADLGLPDAEERLVRAKLGFHVVTLLYYWISPSLTFHI